MCSINYACVFLLLINNMATQSFANQLYGNCSTLHIGELLWQFTVNRTPSMMPYQTAEAEYGPTRAIISCIDITTIGEDGGVGRITSGGVGNNYAKFTFLTVRGKPIHVKVLVYGH